MANTRDPTQSTGLKYFEISDFSPGIWSTSSIDFLAITQPPTVGHVPYSIPSGAPKGAASELNTWGCCAGPNGGLIPLPGNGVDADGFPVPQIGSTFTPVPTTVYMTGFFTRSVLTQNVANLWVQDDELVYMIEGQNTAPNYQAALYVSYPSQTFTCFVFTYTNTNVSTAGVDQFFGCPYITMQTVPVVGQTGNFPQPIIPWRNGDSATPSQHIWVLCETGAAFGTPFLTDIIGGGTNSGYLFTHQGRIVNASEQQLQGSIHSPSGPSQPVRMLNNENFFYTDPPESTTFISVAAHSGVVFWPENPTGYGSATSMSAGELFLVKKQGGALFIQGDLNFPNVTYYKGVQSTGNFIGHSDATSIGAVYCSQGKGAWVWNGGNASQKLSPQLRDDFFTVPNAIPNSGIYSNDPADVGIGEYGNNFGFFVMGWGDKILVSNSWIYDTVTQGWWRLNDTVNNLPYYWYGMSNDTSQFWAAPCGFNQLTHGSTLIQSYSEYQLGHAISHGGRWSWQSLPFRVAEDRRISIREVVLRLMPYQGDNSFVTLYILDEFGNVAQSTTQQCVSNLVGPQSLRFDVGQPKDIQNVCIRVAVEANSIDAAAPQLQSISIAYRESEHVGPTLT